ncbi:MAG: hypothetical protein IV092_22180 [Burkholderiaceae bacterium]|nr:hypothetical protein [Burkholderiaceae bacterium]
MTLGLLSWTGGVWDDSTGTFWIPLGGGHTDYGGNEPYRIQLGADQPAWSMVRNPTGAVGNTGITRDGREATGLYFDGRLRAVHSYNNQTFVPGLGPVISRLAGCYYTATVSPANARAYRIDDAGEAHLLCDYAAANEGSALISSSDGACAFDPTRGARGTLWSLGHGTSRLIQIDIAAGTATARGDKANYLASCDAMHYIPGMDVLAGINRGALKIWQLYRDNYSAVAPALTGNFSAGLEIANLAGFGSCWVPELRMLCLYENSSNRTQISTLTPTRGATDPWVRGMLEVSPANTVTPPAVSSNGGLFGRFGYSSSLRGFYLVPGTTQMPYFFATE